MARRIIKRGTKEVITCDNCGCLFSYEKEDLINVDTDNYKGFKEYTICPQCECEVLIRQTR